MVPDVSPFAHSILSDDSHVGLPAAPREISSNLRVAVANQPKDSAVRHFTTAAGTEAKGTDEQKPSTATPGMISVWIAEWTEGAIAIAEEVTLR